MTAKSSTLTFVVLVFAAFLLAAGCSDESTNDTHTCPPGQVWTTEGCKSVGNGDNDSAEQNDTPDGVSEVVEESEFDKSVEAEENRDTELEITTDKELDSELETELETLDEVPEQDVFEDGAEQQSENECESCQIEGFVCDGDVLVECNTDSNGCCECTELMTCQYGCVDIGNGSAYCDAAPSDGDAEEECHCDNLQQVKLCYNNSVVRCATDFCDFAGCLICSEPPEVVELCEFGCVGTPYPLQEGIQYQEAHCALPPEEEEVELDTSDGDAEEEQQANCECSSDDDCPTGRYCDGCNCTFECIDNRDCTGGFVCNTERGRCEPSPDGDAEVDTQEGPVSCQTHDDCPVGYYCGPFGWCTYDCQSDEDCPEGQRCSDRGWCELASDLDYDIVDVPDEPEEEDGTIACSSHSDCPEWMYCKFSVGECRVGGPRCYTDDDCINNPTGTHCNDGVCGP